MARNQSQIYTILVNNYVAMAAAVGITINPVPLGTAAQWANPPFVSMYNLQGLFLWIVAGGAAITEQLWDAFTAAIGAIAAAAPPQTAQWFQAQMFLFQFNATTPQILQFNTTTFAPYYTTVNTLFQVIKYCTIVPGAFGTTTIKVAAQAGGLPVLLDDGMGGGAYPGALAGAQTYVDLLSVPGITTNVISGNPDNIFIGATVTFNGQYAALIPVANGTVVQAIQAFLASIPASGVVGVGSTVGLMKLTDLIAAVRAVPGVIDFELNNVNARLATTSFVPGVNNLVSGNNWLDNEWNSGLLGIGFMVTETSAGYDINSSLTYIAQ